MANRVHLFGRTPRYKQFFDDYPVHGNSPMFGATHKEPRKDFRCPNSSVKVIERCILMTTDPGDLVLDPTCGSGTTAYVAEQWGRRWITIDTSRVALALARARIMGARYPYYILADSPRGAAARRPRSRRREFVGCSHLRQRPAGVRLRAGAAHHPAGHRQQRRDRRHLRGVPGEAGAAAGGAEPDARHVGGMGAWEEWEIPSRRPTSRGRRRRRNSAPAVLGTAHRPAAGDRRLHRRQGRVRVPVRQALRGPQQGAGGWPLHRGEHLAPPRAGRG